MTDRIDRYVRGELSPEEARALAQESLTVPGLFDELTDASLAKSALNAKAIRAAKVTGWPRKALVLVAALAAAAALVWISLPRRSSIPAAGLKPVLGLSAGANQPVLLASGLQPTGAPVFRGAKSDSRAPQAAGSIVSVEEGTANVNLGSLDGLVKGSELQVFRGGAPIGRLEVTTVFRDRARARVIEGRIKAADAVRVPGADYLGALIEQVDAAFNRGDRELALKLADEAVRWGESAGVTPKALAAAWNHLAVLRMLRGDYDISRQLLDRAVSASVKGDAAYAQGRNNLGVLAELRGDHRTAEDEYLAALAASADTERAAVERNLARVRGSR